MHPFQSYSAHIMPAHASWAEHYSDCQRRKVTKCNFGLSDLAESGWRSSLPLSQCPVFGCTRRVGPRHMSPSIKSD